VNPAIIIQTLARVFYNRSSEPLGHFSDSSPVMSSKEASRELTQRTAEDGGLGLWLLKIVGIAVAIATLICLFLFR
jgi:hypothetical protein